MMTQEELDLCNKLGECFNDFIALPRQHSMETAEFCDAVHRLQTLVMARVAQRIHPESFPILKVSA